VSRGAILALGFVTGRILHAETSREQPAAAAAAAVDVAETVRVMRMDVDVDNASQCTQSALNSAISSAVSQLGERLLSTRLLNTLAAPVLPSNSTSIRKCPATPR